MMAENKDESLVMLCEGDGTIIAVNRPGLPWAHDLICASKADKAEIKTGHLNEVLEAPGIEQRFGTFVESDLWSDSFYLKVRGMDYSIQLRRLERSCGPAILIEMQPSGAGEEQRYLLEAGRLISRMVHDFKNQLGGLKLYIAYLKKRFADHTEIVEIVDKITLSVNAMVDQSMLVGELTRPVKLKPELSDLTAIVEGAIEDHQQSADERGVAIELIIAEGSALVNCDPQQMRRAIGILIIRAIDVARPSSSIRLSIDQFDGKSVIEVADNGETPTDEQLRSIFDFVGTERLTRMSLSLAMARRIAELHGGHASARAVSAPPSTGAVLGIEIPGSRL